MYFNVNCDLYGGQRQNNNNYWNEVHLHPFNSLSIHLSCVLIIDGHIVIATLLIYSQAAAQAQEFFYEMIFVYYHEIFCSGTNFMKQYLNVPSNIAFDIWILYWVFYDLPFFYLYHLIMKINADLSVLSYLLIKVVYGLHYFSRSAFLYIHFDVQCLYVALFYNSLSFFCIICSPSIHTEFNWSTIRCYAVHSFKRVFFIVCWIDVYICEVRTNTESNNDHITTKQGK